MKRSLYAITFISCLYYGWDYAALFGPESYVIRQPKVFSGLHDLAFVIYSHPPLALYSLLLAAGISLAGLLGRRSLLSDLLLWLIILNIHYSIYPGISGGHFLLNQLLLFQSLLSYPRADAQKSGSQLLNFMNNSAAVLIMAQVCLLYAITGLGKLGDSTWREGAAVGMVAEMWHFSWRDQVFVSSPALQKALSYLVMTYQLSFPLFIWFRSIRKLLLMGGFIIYLYIALYMGLVSFGCIMLAAHIYFWPMEESKS